MMKYLKYIFVVLTVVVTTLTGAAAHNFNDKLLNRPYADQRAWHLGFSVGAFVSDLSFTHNGLITDDGQQWRIDQPNYQPGFCVNGLFDLRFNDYFSLRVTPGMYFGSNDITFVDINGDGRERQNIKRTLVVLPVEMRFSALRYRNSRPYLVGGVMPTFDVGKKRSDILQLKSVDTYLTIGFGCDFYLPYFKLVPELKFCFGLSDILKHDRPDLADDPNKFKFTQSLSKAASKMVVLTFYFE
ncbi:MAG: PorT family protein [Muribaculaceae bacterium]|nr:PorT family protein [Muribaculaceae bacterium]